MTQKDNGGPAFPTTAGQVVYSNGMSLRAHAAIHLQQPDSGIDWLDAMILSAKRDAMAGQALVGLLSGPSNAAFVGRGYASVSYEIADAMIAERSK